MQICTSRYQNKPRYTVLSQTVPMIADIISGLRVDRHGTLSPTDMESWADRLPLTS